MASPVGSPPTPYWEMDAAAGPSRTGGGISSSESSQPGSAGGSRSNERKKKVIFTSGDDSGERSPRSRSIGAEDAISTIPEQPSDDNATEDDFNDGVMHSRSNSGEMPLPRSISRSHLPELTLQETREIHEALTRTTTTSKPKPAIRRTQSHLDPTSGEDDDYEVPYESGDRVIRENRMREAFEQGKRLEDDMRSGPASRDPSPKSRPHRWSKRHLTPDDANPGEKDLGDFNSDSDEDMPTIKRRRAQTYHEAEKLVRKHTRAHKNVDHEGYVSAPQSGATTPTGEYSDGEDYQPRPKRYRDGFLSSILKFYNTGRDFGNHSRNSSMAKLLPGVPQSQPASRNATPMPSPPESGTSTPAPHKPKLNRSPPSLVKLVGSSASLGSLLTTGPSEKVSERVKEHQEEHAQSGFRKSSSGTALAALNRVTGYSQRRRESEIRITLHIAETIARQQYMMKLCRALMQYGAPTHRLEEYMRMSARVLEIDAQFLYIPGSMIMSFDDNSTHTTEVKLVRVTQGLDLGKLSDVHEVYKDVTHDRIGVEEATQRLRVITSSKPKYHRWFRIPFYGLAAASVGPFAFSARLIDLPICFFLGCILGVLQLVFAPADDLYANVFEIVAAMLTSFLSRAFGSIWNGDKRLFCFSALAQSSIALILPGYIVLCASLELQSRSIVAGSVRMVYAIIYSLFLGFGITIGTAIYGLMDGAASSETVCADPLPGKWYFLFVPMFTLCLIVINQAKWHQAPAMLVIALAGYVVNYFSARRFVGNTQVSNTLGALAIGVLANVYSRVSSKVENWTMDRWEHDLRPQLSKLRKRFRRKKEETAKTLEDGAPSDEESVYEPAVRRIGYGLAAAVMLPAIFVQVPSGLSANGSLVSGIVSADQIVGNSENGSTVLNTTGVSSSSNGVQTNSIALNVSYSVIQVAIGITVGLFLAALFVYPFGKRRSGLFSL